MKQKAIGRTIKSLSILIYLNKIKAERLDTISTQYKKETAIKLATGDKKDEQTKGKVISNSKNTATKILNTRNKNSQLLYIRQTLFIH